MTSGIVVFLIAAFAAGFGIGKYVEIITPYLRDKDDPSW